MKTFLTILLAITPLNSYGVELIKLAILGLHQGDGKGDYDKIVDQVADFKSKTWEPGRAFERFQTCKDCCISPANKITEFYDFGDNYIESKPMFTAKIYIFSPPGKEIITDLNKLKGKKVGVRQSMPYGKSIESTLQLTKARTIVSNIKKLEKGGLDYMIAYVPDAYTAFEKAKTKPFPHAKDKPLLEHPDRVVCKKSPATTAAISQLNGKISP